MTQKSILYIASDLLPFSNENSISRYASNIPKTMLSMGHDVRVFMPRFGTINERRYQLHEVIRLSGMNLSINDVDQPLLIKVASTVDKMQVYFIDNEEYFKRKALYEDKEGNFFMDNDERALFFAKGVLETIKRLNWIPDIVHLHGWMSALVPLYMRTYYKEDSIYQNLKIVNSLYNVPFKGNLDKNLINKIKLDGIEEHHLAHLEEPNFTNLNKIAIDFSDYIVKIDASLPEEIEDYALENKSKLLKFHPAEEGMKLYEQFHKESILEKVS